MKLLLPSAVIATLTLAAAGPSFGASPNTITVVDLGASATHWPAYIAQDSGFFKKAGVEVRYVSSSSSASGLQQLAAGSADIASAGFPDALRAIDKGAPIRLLRVEEAASPYEVYAKSSIHSFAELKGKTVLLGGPKDVTRTYFERMAFPEGLKPKTYDMTYAGSASARLSGLFSGSVDATILNPPFNFKAQAEHYSLLPAQAGYAKGLPFTSYAVNANWVASHRALARRFLDAYAKGVAWFYAPSHREAVIKILLKRLHVDQSVAEQTYDFYVSHHAFGKNGTVTQSTVRNWLTILKAQGDIDSPVGSKKFYSLQ